MRGSAKIQSVMEIKKICGFRLRRRMKIVRLDK